MTNCPFGVITVKKGKGVGCFQAIVNGIMNGTELLCDYSSN